MYHLKNWYISHYKGYLIAYGDVYNNPRFNQGHLIHTSKLDKIEEYQDYLIAYTKNSQYKCSYKDHREDLKDLLDNQILYQKIKEAINTYKEERTQYLLQYIKDEEKACILVFDDTQYHFNSFIYKDHDYIFYTRESNVSLGMFDDALHIGTQTEFAFIPTLYAVQFYEWDNNYGKVYLLNIGKHSLNISFTVFYHQPLLLRSGDIKLIEI
ncbi:hypothetical protein HMPREF9943_00505 [Eggerthia catenaformis OT 569 = DSM 20559]|uniref:Uncharacterized protein n=1 Tax=Eggerthia catenaformis OT 569 = DSM 20559 TaxID=999415 RepID=M2PNH0_9FIRM|nr:hypothetical protein [Eggerthia catenaformis]EMD17134.1 hypothetical protein HMPREF9943_00505 [Eggerthia catenaformis OT 569 = DSM 20559]